MPAGITDQLFFQEMQKLRDLVDARANAIERKTDDRANAIEKKLDQHAEDDRDLFTAISNRVLVIETQRDNEKNQAVKRGSLFALVGAGGMSLLIAGVRKFFSI